MEDFYQILNIPHTATKKEIKTAYHIQAKLHHPDKNGGSPASTERFKKIQQAYETLYDDGRRAYYDEKLAQLRAREQKLKDDERRRQEEAKRAQQNNSQGYAQANRAFGQSSDSGSGWGLLFLFIILLILGGSDDDNSHSKKK